MNYKQLILPTNFEIFYRRSAAMFKFLNPDLSGKIALLSSKSSYFQKHPKSRDDFLEIIYDLQR
ncbi:MAG TPA: hypothetical protein DCS93_37960 [Microscillaceae bacterium]|nr:hypothetical protein [Microscillaceae bacterium]